MKIPILHKYYSTNLFLYLILFESCLLLYVCLCYFLVGYALFFATGMFAILTVYILHVYVSPILIIMILLEFIGRNTKHIIGFNQITLMNKKQIYIVYSVLIILYIFISYFLYIQCKTPTPEQLRYD